MNALRILIKEALDIHYRLIFTQFFYSTTWRVNFSFCPNINVVHLPPIAFLPEYTLDKQKDDKTIHLVLTT